MQRTVKVIPASIEAGTMMPINNINKRRVAAYARVSTENEEQQSSYITQVSYYTQFIKSHTEWDFVKVYTDEGISGTNTKKRDGFNSMIRDALDGKIDLIITKSVSRFARNTVDALTNIRKLKNIGVEVYFEKENIQTLDSKGELLLTIMSSLAQEESRSISENVKWGNRKSFAEGKVRIPHNLLGYKCMDGKIVIVEEEAKYVRAIFSLFLKGLLPCKIARFMNSRADLQRENKRWWSSTIISILKNEKYKGDALLQKTYTVDFLNKKSKKNEGEIPQYYVESNHEAIIEPEAFDKVQQIFEERKKRNIKTYVNCFSGKIICGDCGKAYGRKVWHSTSKYRRYIWQCNNKWENHCKTKHVYEIDLQKFFVREINKMVEMKEEVITNLEKMVNEVFSVEELERKKDVLIKSLEDFSGEVERKKGVNIKDEKLEEYEKKYAEYTSLLEKIDRYKVATADAEQFVEILKKQDLLSEFDGDLWTVFVDSVVVYKDGKMKMKFFDGFEVWA